MNQHKTNLMTVAKHNKQ